MDWNTILAIVLLTLAIPPALESIWNITERIRAWKKLSAESQLQETRGKITQTSKFRWTQVKIRLILDWLFYFGIYAPYALLWSIGIDYVSALIDTQWTRWLLSGVFVSAIWFSGLVLFRHIQEPNRRLWFVLWVIASLYGGLGVLLWLSPTWWLPNRILIIVVSSVFIVSFQAVTLLHSAETFRDWTRKLPEK